MFKINTIGSEAVNKITVDPLKGDVRVRFHGGTKFYRFENVSRRAILSLMVWQDRSLGQWVNRHCLHRSIAYSL